jgi:vancomycin permeability regulator SanA
MSRRARRYFLMLGGAIGFILLGTVILAVAGLHDHLGRADVGLVLGSKVQRDGTPSPRLRARLDRTLELYRAGYFPAVIVSGATGSEGYDEALVMRDYLVSHGIPAEHVIVDSGGTTTFASAQNAIQIARERRFESFFVVSQYFHLPRARLALQRFGVLTVYSAHARIFELRDIYSSPRELVGYVSYLFRRYDSAAP